MNRKELSLALRTLTFLDSHAADPSGLLELRTGPPRRLLVWHPEAIDWIFRAGPGVRHLPSHTMRPLLGARSMLWANGSRHEAYRRMLGSPLRGTRLSNYRKTISDVVPDAVDALVPATVFSPSAWTRMVTLQIIGRIVLGQVGNDVLRDFSGWLDRALGSRARTLAYRYLLGGLPRSGDKLDRALIGPAKSSLDGQPAALAALLLAPDSPLRGIDDVELRDQVVSLLFAGHETTASATAWTLYWLDRNAQVRQDVLDELAATTDDGSNAARVPLLQAVVEETLRLSPPAMLAGNRATTEDGELLGRPLAAGTILTPSIYLAHHRPDRYPDPKRFDPGRFLDGRVAAGDYFPFGGGNRHCLGSQLAMLEIRMIVAAVLRRRVLRCVNPGKGAPRLRGHAMAPDSGLRMEVTGCLRRAVR